MPVVSEVDKKRKTGAVITSLVRKWVLCIYFPFSFHHPRHCSWTACRCVGSDTYRK